ncbi:lanthionine synthetase LanC family protein [Capnocytophaga felis]|uniref:Lantibiotic biosynthesis protein dehydration domain-containing protein n=1 Tax=Capnocytophaga felis TaxID=2267611 RepID=A0A5M4BD69_9FLAO|nr:lanthionine synthetase LanC family protein [Capnocytophaga felis]GET47036.1 hypothetical protein RCZ01_23380 [Capnocytophaga felis]GET49587.1 hypothetical protein RCZ02_24180 [Capnocytophaga felis]
MITQQPFLDSYTNFLIKKGLSSPNISLWEGKMGIAIYLFHLNRITKNKKYENRAFEFIEEILNDLSHNISLSYATGLLGIGSGYQYILSNEFAYGDSDELLEEIDSIAIHSIDTRPSQSFNSLSLASGICGIGFYLYLRLKNTTNNNDSLASLKNMEYLIYLIDWIEELLLKTNNKQNINDTYFLLCRLHKLNVINFKVEEIISFCLDKIKKLNISLHDNYDLLGINSLKLLKLWI